jgi:hypothetical protein
MTRKELIEFAMWLDDFGNGTFNLYIERKTDEYLRMKGVNNEQKTK